MSAPTEQPTSEYPAPGRTALRGGAWRRLPFDDALEAAGTVSAEGGTRRFVRRFLRQRLAVASLIFLVLMALAAVTAPWLSPYDPDAQDLANALKAPNGSHWLGTDDLGRDVLSRVLHAGRVSLLAAVEAVAVAVAVGLAPGLIAGYLGGRTDRIIMRVADAFMSFPPLVLALTIVGVLGPSLHNAMIAVGLVFAPRVLRMMRGSTLAVREETYVEAARSIGFSNRTIVLREVLPNAIPPIIVQVSLFAGAAMLAEASLSFLGIGVQPPTASWGSMLSRAYRFMGQAPWLAIAPGVAISLCVLSFNMLGDGIRDSFGRDSSGSGR